MTSTVDSRLISRAKKFISVHKDLGWRHHIWKGGATGSWIGATAGKSRHEAVVAWCNKVQRDAPRCPTPTNPPLIWPNAFTRKRPDSHEAPRLPRKKYISCQQMPRLPHTRAVILTKCHACHTKRRPKAQQDATRLDMHFVASPCMPGAALRPREGQSWQKDTERELSNNTSLHHTIM